MSNPEIAKLQNFESNVKRILIVGVSGYLGSALAVGLREDYEVFGSYREHPARIEGVSCFELNCLNGGEIFEILKRIEPDVVLFCIGSRNLDDCQKNKDSTEGLHNKAPALFFKVSTRPFHFVYFSTDQIFDNRAYTVETGPKYFEEKGEVKPVNQYGISKSQAETMLLNHGRYTHVVRVAEIFGENFGSPHWIRSSWVENVRVALDRGQKVRLFTDLIRSHVYLGDVVRAVKLMMKGMTSASMLYNVASTGALSQFDFGKLLCQHFGFNEKLLDPASLADRSKMATPLPWDSSLSNKKFEKDFEFKFPTIDEAIQEYADRLYTGFTRNWT